MILDEIPENSPVMPPTPEAAYLEAKAGADLFGVPLYDWSPSRVIAANAMGLVWPLPPEANDQLRTSGVYAGGLRDSLILCWLRSMPNASEQTADAVKSARPTATKEESLAFLAGWNVQRATRAPREAFEAATEWGAARGIVSLDSDAFAQCYRRTLATLLGVDVSEFDPKPPEGSAEDKDAPPPNV